MRELWRGTVYGLVISVALWALLILAFGGRLNGIATTWLSSWWVRAGLMLVVFWNTVAILLGRPRGGNR